MGNSFRRPGVARPNSRKSWFLALLPAAALLCTPAPAATGLGGAGDQWTTPAGTLEGTRYSSLNEITPANVGKLVEEFAVPTGLRGSHEGQPLVVGATMFVVTPFPRAQTHNQ